MRMKWIQDQFGFVSACGRFTVRRGFIDRSPSCYEILTDTQTGRSGPFRTTAGAKAEARAILQERSRRSDLVA